MTRAQDPDGGAPRARRPLSGPGAGPGAARVEGLDALLREIDGLRSTLETDLSLAAGAVEAGADELAATLLASDRTELAAFEARALGHLRRLEAEDRAERRAASSDDVVVPFVPRAAVARRRRRLARLLPAAPLVAAAAALGVFLGVVPGGTSRPATPDASGAVLSSWEELTRLAAADAPAEDVERAARDLNEDIASMVARASGDPAAARQALALLRDAQVVLATDDDAAQLLGVLSQSRALAARLMASLPPVPLPAVPSPLRSAVTRLPLPEPTLAPPPRSRPSRSVQKAGASPSPTSTRATQRPAPSPAPTPAAATASPSPSSSPRPTPPPVLPGPLNADPL